MPWQRSLRPEEVLPEWRKAVSVLGGEEDVRRFVRTACERLRAPLEPVKEGRFRLPADNLPNSIRERLEIAGIVAKVIPVSFRHPVPAGYEFIHRTHPLVSALADYIAERALTEDSPDLAARCGAIVTQSVPRRTTVLLLRLRSQIGMEQREGSRWLRLRTLLSEEAVGIALSGSEEPRVLTDADALSLMAAQPARNMDAEERSYEVRESLATLPLLTTAFQELAQRRATELLADHTRVREASAAKGMRNTVEACLPADVIGTFVLLPA
jgi:hypothetical protein